MRSLYDLPQKQLKKKNTLKMRRTNDSSVSTVYTMAERPLIFLIALHKPMGSMPWRNDFHLANKRLAVAAIYVPL